MTSVRPRCLGVVLALFVLVPASALAQNGTYSSAVALMIGQTPVHLSLTGSEARWYTIGAVRGRSYCAELGLAEDYRYDPFDTVLTVHRQDHTTVLGDVHGAPGEPSGLYIARVCWIAPATEQALLRVMLALFPPSARYGTLRVVETTLWCPWFFIDGDYNAFTLLRNTTKDWVNVTVTWRGLTGTPAGTYSASIPGNGGVALNARTYVSGTLSGSVEVAHTASPQAIQGSTTTLSGTTGVGFDAVFTQRQPW